MASAPAHRPTNEDRILAFLRASADPQGNKAIAEATGIKPNTVRQMLPLLAKQGRIERVEHGSYRLPAPVPSRVVNGRYEIGGPDSVVTHESHSLGTDTVTGGDTRIAHTARGSEIPPFILARAVLVPAVDLSLKPSGDPILSDRVDVEARARADADGVMRITMPTDAMEPTINAGASVDAVPTDAYVGAGIYVYTMDGRPDVGRIQTGPGGRLILSFENRAYQSYSLIPDGDSYVEAETGLRTTLTFRARIAGSYRSH